MKERVFAAVREMKREQWLICGLAGLLLLVIAAPVKQKEQKKTQEKTTVSQTQEQTDDQIRQSYEKQLESVLSQVEGVGAVQVAVAMESTGKKQVEKDSPAVHRMAAWQYPSQRRSLSLLLSTVVRLARIAALGFVSRSKTSPLVAVANIDYLEYNSLF